VNTATLSPPPPAPTIHAANSLRVLVVDDEEFCRLPLCETLRHAGYDARDAASGAEALALLTSFRPDLVLTDLVMPDMDGIHLLVSVREICPDVEVIVVTGYGTVETAVEAMRKGARNFVLKPFRSSDLLLTVHNTLEARRLRHDHELLTHAVSLLEMGQSLNRTTDINVLPDKASQLVRRNFDADFVTLAGVDTATGQTRILSHIAPEDHPEATLIVREIHEEIRRVIGDGRPITLQSAASASPRLGSTVIVPLFLDSRPRGAIAIARLPGREAYTDDDARLLQAFSPHLATALENARLFTVASNRIQELEDLDTTGKILSLCTDPGEIGAIALHSALRLTRAQGCALLIAGPSGISVRAVPPSINRDGRSKAIELRMTHTYMSLAAGEGAAPPPIAPSPGESSLFRSFISVPLVSPHGILGLIASFSEAPNRFDASHVRLLSAIGNNAAIAIQNVSSFSEMHSMYRETIMALAEAIDAKDHYTHGHSDKVRCYAALIARELGLPHDELRKIEDAALLHDIGKISVPEVVLNKPGRLTPNEMDVIRSHVVRGGWRRGSLSHLRELVPIVRHHHERYDGKGYPDAIGSQDIPLNARICAIADTYDAMTSDRIYRNALPVSQAIQILRDNAGAQFDPELVPLFIDILGRQKLSA